MSERAKPRDLRVGDLLARRELIDGRVVLSWLPVLRIYREDAWYCIETATGVETVGGGTSFTRASLDSEFAEHYA